MEGAAWADAAMAAGVPAANIRSFPDMPSVFSALGRGEVGAAVMSLSDFVLQRRRVPGLVAGPFVGGASTAAWAVRKTDSKLQAALNDYIANIRRDAVLESTGGRILRPGRPHPAGPGQDRIDPSQATENKHLPKVDGKVKIGL